jgi:small subunit ribosomal protein S12
MNRQLSAKKNPQKKVFCLKSFTLNPKKPNSANRAVFLASSNQIKYNFLVKIPGEKHQLQQYSTVLIGGAKMKDLIGVSYSSIRGKYDLLGVSNRKTSRSLYGIKLTTK